MDASKMEMVDNNFRAHQVSLEQAETLGMIRQECRELATFLVSNCPESRELSLALTNLEQVMFWADAAVARYDPMDPHAT